MRLDHTQQMLLDNVATADKLWRSALVDAKSVGKAAEREHIRKYAEARDNRVRLAHDGGVPVTQIHTVGLGTSARKTATDALDRTEAAARAAAESFATDPYAQLYALDEHQHLIVTPAPKELYEALVAVGQASTSTDEAISKGIGSAQFRVEPRADGTFFLDSITPRWNAELEHEHPVVGWAQEPEREAQAVAWWREKVAA